MMKLKSLFVLAIIIVGLILSCTDRQKKEEVSNNIEQVDSSQNTGTAIAPLLINTDSIEIIYFDDPYGDSLRYTRYYSYLSSRDTGLIKNIVNQINTEFDTSSLVKPCRSEGKIMMHHADKVLKTLYFSTACDSCCYVYLIQDGLFYYFQMSDKLATGLKDSRRFARKPRASDEADTRMK